MRIRCRKVNIIAHSKGGLEARYLISSLHYDEKAASLTTISTPHHGSVTMQKVLKFLLKIVGFFMNIRMRIMGDKKPNAYKAYLSFRADTAEEFNKRNPDSYGVYYQSYAFSMRHDMLLWFSHFLIACIEGETTDCNG